jgi:alpha-beta hydrolase superfamily lysophospholipase
LTPFSKVTGLPHSLASVDRSPSLRFTGDGAKPEAVVLLLHGGSTDSFAAVPALDPAVLRMIPFGRSVLRAGGGRIAVARLRYAVRGWNGEWQSPLRDARWALDRIAARFGGLPIGLVGHSMGGRVALRVVDHGGVLASEGGTVHSWGVHSVAALAPWLPDGEPIPLLDERALLLAHGTADRTTDPAKTAELADKLAEAGCDVELVKYPGARHGMLFPARAWHDMVASFMVRTLLAPALEGPAGPSGPARH